MVFCMENNSPKEIEVITVLIENGFRISVLPYMDIVHLHNLVAIALSAKTVSLMPLQRLELWTP